MTTNIAKGIELLSDKPGSGTEAVKGSSITVSPHLAYGKKGLADLIPADAMLRIQLWVHDVH